MWATSKNQSGEEKSLRFPKPHIAGSIHAGGALLTVFATGTDVCLE
jgi:hypothetical protein